MIVTNKPNRDGALAIPAAIAADPGAVEILSVWFGSDRTNMVLARPDSRPGVAPWALLLADIACYIAHVHAAATNADPARTMSRLRSIFNAELDRHREAAAGR